MEGHKNRRSTRPRVAHFVRKDTQFRASFIQNQVQAHVRYQPVLLWRAQVSKPLDGGYGQFDGAPYPRLDLSQGQRWLDRAWFAGPGMLSPRQQRMILEFLREQRVALCHFHYGTDCGLYYPLLRKLKIPSVVSFYGYDCSSFPGRYFGYGAAFLQRRVFRDASAVFAMSPDMKKDLLNAGCPEEKVIVHYYGTDCRRFFVDRQFPEKEEVTLLMVASLEPQKGHEFLFRSLLGLKKDGIHNWKLRLVGAGRLEEDLKALAARSGLSGQIAFLGALKYGGEELIREYKQADIFVHPSVTAGNGDKEGIPGTVVEAMAAGLPVISTYHAGIPYIIEQGRTGLLAGEWDIECLRAHLSRLIAAPGLRAQLGTAGQAYALKHLDLQEKEKELEAIYSQICAG
ncbi:MAG: glycosyltransferase [Phaeodactylibacter sp.]|nr:glycosyltransferase [Phaeodactylibacter sp.]MCB9292752.1 glycosyltransferase [Lewinellaceae bacterium]